MRFTKREQMAILLLVVGIISIIGYNVIMGDNLYAITEAEDENFEEETEEAQSVVENENVIVYICGQVHNPGIVILPKGARLYEAFDQVGGLIEGKADLHRINPARILEDEKSIYIPEIGEDLKGKDIYDMSVEGTTGYSNGKISLNTAPKDVLCKLPGVGEVTAMTIIEYREKNRFQSIKELKNISGIGSKKYNDIKDLITVK